MLERVKKIVPFVLLGCIVLFYANEIWRSSKSPRPPEHQARTERAYYESKHDNILSDAWNWTTQDPVSFYTFVLAIFTGAIGAIAIIQIRYLRKADETARIAAGAAKESADVARQSLVDTQRAFVRVANFPWLWRPDSSRPGKYLYDITPTIENGGNTPTVDMKINVASALRDEPLPKGFEFSFTNEAAPSLIGAHQSIGASRAVIFDDDLLAVAAGKKFFYIWGTITYRDVFKLIFNSCGVGMGYK